MRGARSPANKRTWQNSQSSNFNSDLKKSIMISTTNVLRIHYILSTILGLGFVYAPKDMMDSFESTDAAYNTPQARLCIKWCVSM